MKKKRTLRWSLSEHSPPPKTLRISSMVSKTRCRRRRHHTPMKSNKNIDLSLCISFFVTLFGSHLRLGLSLFVLRYVSSRTLSLVTFGFSGPLFLASLPSLSWSILSYCFGRWRLSAFLPMDVTRLGNTTCNLRFFFSQSFYSSNKPFLLYEWVSHWFFRVHCIA
ncbi:hypothetical protein CPC08DRAFT_227388 [Agrocybe pediades]|nr:hypothetical protein CPC08DRAFT_227388 [Agrocybe pediades]